MKEELQRVEQELAAAEAERDALGSASRTSRRRRPGRRDEDDAASSASCGDPPQLEGAKENLELGRFDMERAAKMSGARFGYWIGDTARLALALYRFALDRLAAKGFSPCCRRCSCARRRCSAPAVPLGRAEHLRDPADGLYLAGTAEIPVASLHAGEILEADELPLRYVAFSPCFRREAGAAGRTRAACSASTSSTRWSSSHSPCPTGHGTQGFPSARNGLLHAFEETGFLLFVQTAEKSLNHVNVGVRHPWFNYSGRSAGVCLPRANSVCSLPQRVIWPWSSSRRSASDVKTL